MKKKRLLSLLLAAMLASSSFSLTAAAAAPEAIAEPSASATVVASDGWLANGAALAASYDYNENWEGDNGNGARYIGANENYTRISAADASTIGAATAYSVGGQTLPAGNYKLSFAIRNDPEYANESNAFSLRFGGYVESCGAVLKLGDRHEYNNTANKHLFTVNSVKQNGVDYTGTYDPYATADWVTYEVDITSYVSAPFKIIVAGTKTPINIKDWKIEGFDGRYKFSGVTYPAYSQVAGASVDILSYYTTADTDITSLVYVGADDTVYNAGSYALSTSVRASQNTTITADVKGTTASVNLIAGEWTDVEFKLEMRERFKMSDIVIDLGGASIDFTDLAFAGDELEISDKWESPDGKQVVYIEDNGDYTRLVAPDDSKVAAEGYYTYLKVVDLPAGTYKFSADVRNSASSSTNTKNGFFVGIDGWYSGNSIFNPRNANSTTNVYVNSAALNGAPVDTQFPILTSDWQKYESEFTIDSAKTLYIAVFRYNGFDYCTADLKNLSIINTATNTEVVENGAYTFTSTTFGNSVGGAFEKPVSHYTTAGTNATQLLYVGADKTFAPGLYTFTTYAKSSEEGILALTATNSTILASAPISELWQKVTLEVDARESFSMSDVVLEFNGDLYFSEFEIDGYEYIFNEDWEGDNGEMATFVDISEAYTVLSALDPENVVEEGYSSNFKVVDLPAGTYKFSVDVRNSASSSTNVKNGFFAGINGWYSGNAIFNPRNANSTTNVYVNSAALNGAPVDTQFPILTSDWQKYESEFTIDSAKTLYIAVFRYNGFDYCTADLKNLSIINTATNTEVVENGAYTLTPTTEMLANGGVAGTVDSHYTTKGSGAVALKPTAAKECAPGLYTITGNFNAPEGATLTATVNGTTYASVEIGTAWQELEIVIDIRDSFNIEDIRLAFDCDYINFSDMELTESVYTILGNWEGENGEIIVKVDVPESYYVLSSGNPGATNGYSFTTPTIPSGSFKLTFDMRLDPDALNAASTYLNLRYGGHVESCGSLHNVQDRYMWNNPENKYLFTVTSSKVNGVDVTGTAVRTYVTSDWSTYEIEFNSDGSYPIWFILDTASENVNIRNFSVTRAPEFTEVVIDDVSAFVPAGNGYGTSSGVVRMEQPYYTTKGSGATSISPAMGTASDYELIAGVYQIKGNFRANGESATLKAFAGAAQLSTLSGETSVALNNNSWREITFVLDSVVDLNTTDIRLAFDGDIDFTGDIEIELIERHMSIEDVDMGTVIMFLLLRKEELDSYDPINMLTGSISRSLKNWEYGDQTLKFVRSDDGNYLAARDITSNLAGFTYNPKASLKVGLYEFSVDIRTSNPGETDYIRIKLGDYIHSEIITNEWLTVKFMYSVEKRSPLVLKFFGGPMTSSVKDYDIRNIKLINTDDIPGGYNLYPDGGFDTEGKYGFYMGYGSGEVEWHEEDGNGYLSIVGRDTNHSPIRKQFAFDSFDGATYTISYDIRATHEGESFTVRAYMNNVGLQVANANKDSGGGIEYDITHEWMHIETTYIASGKAPMVFDIKGGQTAEDTKDFDIDNLVITKKGGATEDDMYPAGKFDDESTALQGWYGGFGAGTAYFAWNEENGDGYVTVYDRSMNYTPANIKLVSLKAGTPYKISYDIRATHEGEKFTVRAYANGTALTVAGASNASGNEFIITNEWRHVESTYIPTENIVLDFSIKGGQTAEDNKDFDINNLVIALNQ